MNDERKETIVEVDGQQVFTADWVFEQMGAQSCRIDRARAVAFTAMVIALCSVGILITVLVR